MAKINVLSSDIYNKISAGEVVERPASVVKELVENSIDAGATEIVVAIAEGGIKSIEVLDNGCGISSEQVKIAFLPHSTSKLKLAEDLDSIMTLGFRGEALSSIASVSKVKITTRTIEEDIATRLELVAGEVTENTLVSANVGTRIEVNDLFFNTPARKKFLKTPSREGSEISNYITRLIFANPTTKIKYIIDGKTIFDFKGKGIEEAIYTIYGQDCLDNCIYVESSIKDTVIKGYIGSPDYTKANSTYQTIIINGRYVMNSVISSAVKNAYIPYLMTRQYPFYVLNLIVPYDEIDVNVHPSKLEVRLLHGQDVYMASYLATKDALTNATKAYKNNIVVETEPIDNEQNAVNVSMFPPKNVQSDEFARKLILAKLQENKNSINQNLGPLKPHSSVQQCDFLHQNNKIDNTERVATEFNENYITQSDYINKDAFLSLNQGEYNADNGVEQPNVITEGTKNTHGIFSDARFLGIIFNTYIMLERGDFLFIIDQHACHERILYDKYMEEYNKNEINSQPLLVPYVFEVTDGENIYIQQNMASMRKGGFEVEEFGRNTYKLNAIPSAFVNKISIEDFVKEVLTNIRYFDMSTSKLTSDLLARRACRSAIKGGDTLDRVDVYALLTQLDNLDNLKCPHGRPIVVVYSKVEFEKWFKRIV